jgi:dynein heavy chain 1
LAYEPEKNTDKIPENDRFEKPLWKRQLLQSVKEWIRILPKNLLPIKRTLENIKDPLFRFFEREINTGIFLIFYFLNRVLYVLNFGKSN